MIKVTVDEHIENTITEVEALAIQEAEAVAKAEEEAIEQAKQAKAEALVSITVTTTNGNTFNGDEVARIDMLSAITTAPILGLTEHSWKLADNSWVVITLDELKEALALAIQTKGQILSGGTI